MVQYLVLVFMLFLAATPSWCGVASIFGAKQEQTNQESKTEEESSTNNSPASSVFSSSSKKNTNTPSSRVFGNSSGSSSEASSNSSSKASSVFGSRGRYHNRTTNSGSSVAEDNNTAEEGKTAPENPRVAPEFLWPVDGGHVSSFFGWRNSSRFHDGIDIMAPKGTKIFASKSGQVIYSDKRIKGYGNMIVIRHNGGLHTVYAHNDVNKVKKGSIVSQGDVIALVGSTGHASGPHLHFEVRKGKYSKDPLKYLGGVPANNGAYKNNDGAELFSK